METSKEPNKKEMLKQLLPMDDLAELLEEMGFVRASTGQPVKEEPVPTKPVEEPMADLSELVSELVGTLGKDLIYTSKDWSHYYQVTPDGYVFPRGSNTSFESKHGAKLTLKANPSPEKGGLGVPLRYVLPVGYQWRTVGDGAYYIVKSDQIVTKGPAWLETKTEPSKNAGNNNAGANTGWEIEHES